MIGTEFTPATQAWFDASFPGPTDAQAEGWESISSGHHTLIHAPTGSGKTLAAFLWTIDRLLHEPTPERWRAVSSALHLTDEGAWPTTSTETCEHL